MIKTDNGNDRQRAVAVGNFDGVHRGHRLLLGELLHIAATRSLTPAVVTFSSHPLALIAPERTPAPLQTSIDRRADLEALGLEVIELDFTDRLRHLSSSEFLQFIHTSFNARCLLLGHDNRFGYRSHDDLRGKDRDYIIEYYRRVAPAGFEILPAPELAGISSSAIRRALRAGDVQAAAAMLGHPYRFTSTVIHGRQLGRTIGFPTANLSMEGKTTMLPAPGVYAASTDGSRPTLVNIGRRPTVDGAGAPLSVEAYIDGFRGDLYGKPLSIDFLRRLRDERRFSSLDALKTQLEADLSALRHPDV